MATWVHCGRCRRAFDAAARASCPACGRRLAPEPAPPAPSPVDAVIGAALDAIAAAIDGAGPEARAAVRRALAARRPRGPWDAAAADGLAAALAEPAASTTALAPPRDDQRVLWTTVVVAALARGVARRLRVLW